MSYILDALRRAEADRERERGAVPGLHSPTLPGADAPTATASRRWLPWMGGGALLTPILVLGFGIDPTRAVGSDLLVSLVMKPVGGGVHLRRGTVNLPIVVTFIIGVGAGPAEPADHLRAAHSRSARAAARAYHYAECCGSRCSACSDWPGGEGGRCQAISQAASQ